MLAFGEMCFEGMGAVAKGVSRWHLVKCVLRAWGQLKCVFRGRQVLRCWHLVKCVLRAWGQLQRGFHVLALGEMCFRGMGAVAKGVSGVGTG